ncbi:MAG: hypothetical protein V3R48_03245 [Thermoplasmata archaeon]
MVPTSSRPPGKERRQEKQRAAEAAPALAAPPSRHFWVPLSFTLALVPIAFVERVRDHPVLVWSVFASVGTLLAWQAWLFLGMKEESTTPAFSIVLRAQHYLQACLQLSVFGYWGWYWRPVYEHAWLLLAQLLFAYAFGILLAWSRRQPYALGFGVFPIVLSTNLFLWFRDDWFYLQFLMIAVGFLGKEFVRWTREGRRVHIFNPSAFSLGLFSVVLIAMNATDLTWGQEIASTLSMAPRIYTFLFVIGLIAMYNFSITLVSGLAAVVLFGWSAGYFTVTGVPYFIDSEIPSAVFLGLYLLVTDPSTSPRTPLGKAVFGLLYGVSVFALFAGLDVIGAPRFYDKLLAVPLLNLSVQQIDRLARTIQGTAWWGRMRPVWPPARLNLAHMALWIPFFILMTATGRTDGRHTGHSVPFWEQACEEGRRKACDRLLDVEYSYCVDNSGWACNEVGRHLAEGRITDPDPELARGYFIRACEARFQPGCLNLLEPEGLAVAPPRTLDLRLLVREGRATLLDMPEPELYARACDHQWDFACEALALRSL